MELRNATIILGDEPIRMTADEMKGFTGNTIVTCDAPSRKRIDEALETLRSEGVCI